MDSLIFTSAERTLLADINKLRSKIWKSYPNCIMPVVKLSDYAASCKSVAKTSAGVLNPRHLRGVALRLWAKAVNCAWLTCVRSVLLGKYRRMRLLMFSIAPFCHGELGSQNQLLAPIPSSKA
jgi:hypothetical protein